MTKLNAENKKKQYEAALDANLPALNANSHIMKKPYPNEKFSCLQNKRHVQPLSKKGIVYVPDLYTYKFQLKTIYVCKSTF